jgi:cell wall-associated NlpC family hydrolase
MDVLSNDLDKKSEEYDFAKAQLSDTNKAVKKSENELKTARKDLAAAQATLSNRVVEIYESGNSTYLDLIASAQSVSDLVERVSVLQQISKQDADLVAQVTSRRNKVTQRNNELLAQQTRQKQLTQDAKVAEESVKAEAAAQAVELAGKKTQIAALQAQENARQAQLAAAARAALARNNAGGAGTGAGGGTGGTATVSGNKVVNYAMNFLGYPYVWAAAGPSSFDCSGFVMYVYAHFGVSLPHSARMQYSCGTPVSRANLQPGDLVFFYNPIHHVGIYIGNGEMINAAGTGKGVRIDSIWSTYYGACRL